jgi:hypothetical protein
MHFQRRCLHGCLHESIGELRRFFADGSVKLNQLGIPTYASEPTLQTSTTDATIKIRNDRFAQRGVNEDSHEEHFDVNDKVSTSSQVNGTTLDIEIGFGSLSRTPLTWPDNPPGSWGRRLGQTIWGGTDSRVPWIDASNAAPPRWGPLGKSITSLDCGLSPSIRPEDNRLHEPSPGAGPFEEGRPSVFEAIHHPRGVPRPGPRPRTKEDLTSI